MITNIIIIADQITKSGTSNRTVPSPYQNVPEELLSESSTINMLIHSHMNHH